MATVVGSSVVCFWNALPREGVLRPVWILHARDRASQWDEGWTQVSGPAVAEVPPRCHAQHSFHAALPDTVNIPAKVSYACDVFFLSLRLSPRLGWNLSSPLRVLCGLDSQRVPPPSDLFSLGLHCHAAIFKSRTLYRLGYHRSDLTLKKNRYLFFFFWDRKIKTKRKTVHVWAWIKRYLLKVMAHDLLIFCHQVHVERTRTKSCQTRLPVPALPG